VLKRKLCEATFQWKLTCDGPLLIADGRYDHDKLPKEEKGKYPHKVFISHATDAKAIESAVKNKTAETLGLPFYVPGTSLRGPFRAQAERIIRSLLPENAIPPLTACDPFQDDEKKSYPLSCSKRLNQTEAPVPYAAVCPACKLFGCTGTASRIYFTDADIERCFSVYRDMIGIDRFTGGVFQGEKGEKGEKKSGGANMRFHALENTGFTTTVTVTNFELWQLGLLAYVFRDFQEGLVPIGFGKTKGFGLVKGIVEKITLTYPIGKASSKIQHLGSLASETERQCYGLDAATATNCDGLQPESTGGLSLYETFSATNKDAFWAAVAPAFNSFIEARSKEIKP
jgi:CRISPR/Cas system CSM-associated protein Csm3 (group 7 of RAMP superfamily)